VDARVGTIRRPIWNKNIFINKDHLRKDTMEDQVIYKRKGTMPIEITSEKLTIKIGFSRVNIPIENIASANFIAHKFGIFIETTGGKKHKIPCNAKVASEIESAINKARSSSDNQSSDLDELEKLSKLKDKGVITQDEFDKKKKSILNS